MFKSINPTNCFDNNRLNMNDMIIFTKCSCHHQMHYSKGVGPWLCPYKENPHNVVAHNSQFCRQSVRFLVIRTLHAQSRAFQKLMSACIPLWEMGCSHLHTQASFQTYWMSNEKVPASIIAVKCQ